MRQPKPYHIKRKLDVFVSDEQLEKWAVDPNCVEAQACADELAKRRERIREKHQAAQEAERQRLSKKRQALQDDPFDPRTEISADARHIASRIVTHLWILFVLLPVIIGLLYALVTAR